MGAEKSVQTFIIPAADNAKPKTALKLALFERKQHRISALTAAGSSSLLANRSNIPITNSFRQLSEHPKTSSCTGTGTVLAVHQKKSEQPLNLSTGKEMFLIASEEILYNPIKLIYNYGGSMFYPFKFPTLNKTNETHISHIP